MQKKPDEKKLARVLDRAYKAAVKTGNTKRIQAIADGIAKDRRYTKDVLKGAMGSSKNFFGAFASYYSRSEIINSLYSDTVTGIRTQHKFNEIERLWGQGGKPAEYSGAVKEAEFRKKNAAKAGVAKVGSKLGRIATKSIPVIGWGVAGYFAVNAAASAYSKTGSMAMAAEAGLNDLSEGAYGKSKSDLHKSRKNSKAIMLRRRKLRNRALREEGYNTKGGGNARAAMLASARKVVKPKPKSRQAAKKRKGAGAYITVTNKHGTTFKRRNTRRK